MPRGVIRAGVLSAGLTITGCAHPAPASGSAVEPAAPPSSPLALLQPPPEQGERWGPQDEINADGVRQIFHDTLVADTGDDPMMRRDAHPKHHGCVKGMLTIESAALAAEYRQGLFASNGQYQAWVRFSNGDSNPDRDDREPNFRGVAIKIMGVPYPSYLAEVGYEADNPVHDLVLLNSPTFFVKNTDEYLEFMQAVHKGGGAVLGFSMSHGKNMRILQKSRKMKVGNVLDLDYHSATPYKLGPTSMRMTMASCNEDAQKRPPKPSPHFLGERLEASLASGEACFVFLVQPNEDPERNPIEDPRRSWDAEVSPLVEVGRLTLPKQTGVRSPEQMRLCEQMSFNPWRAPAANRPMGQANRIRLEVYTRQSQLRNGHNEVVEPRPTSFDAPR